MTLHRLCLAALLCLAAAPAFAQQPPPDTRADILIKNGLKLAGSLRMDRQVYCVGETTNFAVTIWNPTATPLEVLKPFDYQTGWFVGSRKRTDRNGVVRWTSGQTDIVHTIPADAPSVVMQPGESVAHEYHFYDDLPGCLRIYYPLTASTSPGARRFQYAYGNWPSAEYQVVAPVLEEFVVVQLPKVEGAQQTEATFVFSLASGGQHFLCARRQPITDWGHYRSRADLRLSPDGVLTPDEAHLLSPYSRFAESDTPFESLAATADAESNLTITWIARDPSAPSGTRPSTLVLQKANWLVEPPPETEDNNSDDSE
jgi:hypothetical protein